MTSLQEKALEQIEILSDNLSGKIFELDNKISDESYNREKDLFPLIEIAD